MLRVICLILYFVITAHAWCIDRSEFKLINPDTSHPPLEIEFQIASGNYPNYPIRNTDEKICNFRKVNLPLLYEALLRTDWPSMYTSNDHNIVCSEFYKTLDLYVTIRSAIAAKVKYPPWFSGEIIHNIKMKWYHHSKFMKKNNNFHFLEFKKYRSHKISNQRSI